MKKRPKQAIRGLRRCKIIASIGPSCSTVGVMRQMILEGAEIIRINASHCSGTDIENKCRLIRRASALAGKKTKVLIDLQGPRLRTGGHARGGLRVQDGQFIRVLAGAATAQGASIAVPWPLFTTLVARGSLIFIDNGLIILKVLACAKQTVNCRVIKGGVIGENKGLNLPDVRISSPSLTEKDLLDLKTAARLDVDYIALSFVRSHLDILKVREWMAQNDVDIPLVAKLEKPSAVRDAKLIFKVCDAVMVARGDLGVEIGLEKVPCVQRDLLKMGARQRKPVMVATHFLESMIEKPLPTRAEVSDIANAVFAGAWGLVLTGETAIGKYPVEAIRMMNEIIRETCRVN